MKLAGKLTLLASLLAAGLFFWKTNALDGFSGRTKCPSQKRFLAMDFEAYITDTIFTETQKLFYVTTFTGEESVINFSTDSMTIYTKMTPNDSLFKKYGSQALTLKNESKYLVLTPHFNCK